jgi:energy-coupling factor transport system ATP-binding protein
MVFQDFEAQLFSTNVELEVAFGPENLGLPREEIVRRVDDNLRLASISTVPQMTNARWRVLPVRLAPRRWATG